MGKIKQLLPYRGRTFIAHVMDQAFAVGFAPMIVVLGAKADEVKSAVDFANCEVVVNEDWNIGMGSSLRTGMKKLLQVAPETNAIAVLLVDQPRITMAQLSSLRTAFEQGRCSIVAAEYGGTVGVPAIFHKEVFPLLLNLSPEAGARHLLRDAGSSLLRYPLPEAAIDVDTPADYSNLI